MSKRFELTKDHITLLQKAHLRWEECEYGAPAIDCKRPYGNSSVEQDICEILGWKPKKDEYGDVSDDNQELWDKCRIIHQETETALQIILHTKSFQPGTYILEDDFSNDWKYAGDIK